MKAQEIKNKLFKGFIQWLNDSGIGDHFSPDIWMKKAFDYFFEQYSTNVENAKQLEKLITLVAKEDLENELKRRATIEIKQKEASDKAKKEQDKAKENIDKTREEVIKEKGKDVVDLNKVKEKKDKIEGEKK